MKSKTRNQKPEDVLIVHRNGPARGFCNIDGGEMLGVPVWAARNLPARPLGMLCKMLTLDDETMQQYLALEAKHQFPKLSAAMEELSRAGYAFMEHIHGDFHFIVRHSPITQSEADAEFAAIRQRIDRRDARREGGSK